MYVFLYLAIYVSICRHAPERNRGRYINLLSCFVQYTFSFFQKKSDMAREVTWWLRTRVALTEGLSPVRNTHVAVHNCL